MSAEITARSLSSLTAIVQSCAAIPGRKLLFVLSDGFVLQQQRDDVSGRIKEVTTAAQRAGVVIYTLDTRGLVVGLPDAASPAIIAAPVVRDAAGPPPNQLERLQQGFSDVLLRQDGLNALASDTGGRFLKNTNALGTAITETLEATSRYYLLGWHVDPDKLQAGHLSSIRVTIKDRPDLKASLRQSSMDLSTLFSKEPKSPNRASSQTTARSELVKAIEHPWPIDTLPVSLYAGYLYRSDKGYALDVSLQVRVEDTDTGAGSAKEDAHIDIMVAIANRDGAKVDSFMESVSQPVGAASQSKGGIRRFAYSRLISIEAGIYQVRVAARDPKSGKVGTAHQWIDVRAAAPDQVFLGSIFLAAGSSKTKLPVELTEASLDENQFSTELRFSASSGLSFTLEIYNPSKQPVMFETRVYRGNRAVMRSMPQPLLPETSSDTGLQFISSEMPLLGLVTGPYVFEVSTTDKSGKITATQRVPFWIQ